MGHLNVRVKSARDSGVFDAQESFRIVASVSGNVLGKIISSVVFGPATSTQLGSFPCLPVQVDLLFVQKQPRDVPFR
jgi:hypothetical protein